METKNNIKRVVITGPESTGKSTLCEQLAAHYNTVWVKEYAREYLELNGTDYGFEDLYAIAEGQIAREEKAVSELQIREASTFNFPPVFIDTDLYVMKVWSEFVFNKCDNKILTQIAHRTYDLYLLCNVDLPWVKDGLREYPDLITREKLFHYYKEEMAEQHAPWVIITGNYEERLQHAVNAVDRLISLP